MQYRAWLLVVLLAAGPGCRARQLQHDQDHIRSAVLDLQTNQIMDNLIRIRRGLPIIQLDYSHMTGTVTDTVNGAVNGSDTDQGVHVLLAVTRTFTNLVGYSAGANQVKQLTITAEPVLNAPEVYNAYLEFLKDSAHLVATDEPPPADAALIVRCRYRDCCDADCALSKHRRKVYYWVPCEYRAEFFKLALYVVALRGQPIATSPNFDVTIKSVKDVKDLMKPEGAYEVTIVLDKKIPNDRGFVIATVKGRTVDGPQNLQLEKNPGPDAPPKDDTFRLSFNVGTLAKALAVDKLSIDDVVKDLNGQKVGIRLHNFFPSGSPTERMLEDIRYQLELNRLGQFQLAH